MSKLDETWIEFYKFLAVFEPGEHVIGKVCFKNLLWKKPHKIVITIRGEANVKW